MNDEKREPTTPELVASAASTRRRVASDVERLASQLAPAQLKERALDVAEHSLETLATRALQKLRQSPRRIASYARQHPLVGVAVLAGAGLLVWRVAVGRHR
jgi:ElaB/YqjD/DUF883 family membrane-anchored ribosome-binding protein